MKTITSSLIISALLFTGCFVNKDNLPGLEKYGKITGSIYNEKGDSPIKDVQLLIEVKGKIYTGKSSENGSFSLDTGEITRGEGFTLHFVNDNFESASRGVIFDLPNLRIDLGKVILREATDASLVERKVRGTIHQYDDSPLEGAIISMQNSNSETIHAVSDSNGNFEISGKYLYIGSSYNLTISKANHVTSTSVIVNINGSLTIMNSPCVIYKSSGDITGNILDDETGNPLTGTSVSSTDKTGILIATITDANGNFRLSSSHFYLDSEFTINISKDKYYPRTKSITISSVEDNIIPDNPIKLMIDGKITGTILSSTGEKLSGITASTIDTAGTTIQVQSDSEGNFLLASIGFRKGTVYNISFSHDDYENKLQNSPNIVEGENSMEIILAKKDYSYRLTGKVNDKWDSGNIAASVTMVDNYGNTRTATCDGATGIFEISGIFLKDNEYQIDVSMTGYTGETEVSKQSVNITITQSMEEQTDPQEIGTISLYPIALCAKIGTADTKFTKGMKNTHEKFLTGNIGFTLSARNSDDLNASSTFYLHVDDKNNPLPTASGGVHSSLIKMNGASSGTINHGYDGEELSRPEVQKPSKFKMHRYTMYHFYISEPGEIIIETTGTTDTEMALYYHTGSQVAIDDNSGSGNNSKITYNAEGSTGAGWYFVKIQGSSDNIWGDYDISLTGPEQNYSTIGTWETDDLVLSFYSHSDKVLYIAGKNEAGSTATVLITKMEKIGKIIRGEFTGTLRAITAAGTTIQVTNGYFNILRSE